MKQKEIEGVSQHIKELRQEIDRAAKSDLSILIQGPTGTGKELIANNIHYKSNRKGEPFEIMNCGAVPSELFESEFYGHKKGSYTGATSDKKGMVQLADGGTLFLDEIGNLRLDHQVKVLRFLQDRSYCPIGGNTTTVDVRIIAATNRELLTEIQAGSFREDLYYRLSQYNIYAKPLAVRPEDVIFLVNHFSPKRVRTEENAKIRFLLYTYNFPGNVRELKGLVGNHDYGYIARELWRRVCSERGKPLGLPVGYDPDDYKLVDYFGSLRGIDFDFKPTAPEVERYGNFKRALRLVENNDIDLKKHVRAYEIIQLYQRTTLSKKDIAKILKIRANLLGPSEFKSTFGFDFPDRKLPYLIYSPFSAYPSPVK